MAGLTLIGTVSVAFSNTTPQTTAALNTTGAVLIVIVKSDSPFFSSGSGVTDSKGNTLNTAGASYTEVNNIGRIQPLHCISPGSVGAGHTWTVTGTGAAPQGYITVYAYSDTNGAPTKFNQSGLGMGASGTSVQPGSLTPSTNGSVCISGVCGTGTQTGMAVDSGYSIDASSATRFFAASQIQSTAAALNPTWSWSGSLTVSVMQVIFTPAAGGGGGTTVSCGLGVATLTGFAPAASVTDNKNVLAGLGQITVTGFAPTVVATDPKNVLSGVGVATLTGFAPSISVSAAQNVLSGVGVGTLTGFAPTVGSSNNQNILAALGQLSLTGFAPLATAPNNQNVLSEVGVLLLSGFAPIVTGDPVAPNAKPPYFWRHRKWI